MKLVFFSDIHGNGYAFRAFQRQMERERPDLVVFCGDVFGYYYQQPEILEGLRAAGWHCLLGNHDKYYLDALDGKRDIGSLCEKYGSSYKRCMEGPHAVGEAVPFLRSLKPHTALTVDGLNIAAYHGSPADPLEGRIYPDTPMLDVEAYAAYDFVILGHTHHKMVRRAGGAIVINPGSLGQQRDGRGCSYLTLDTQSREFAFQTVTYDIAALLREISVNDPDKGFLASVLTRKPQKGNTE